MKRVEIEPWLPLVAKPSRYIDHEINAVHKPWQGVNICFAFPDVYELGISHLGLKILYSIVNGIDGAMADRCYLPWTDLSAIMRQHRIPLFGIESRAPLRDFDLVGITLQSELNYSNVLELLDLAGMQVKAEDRAEGDPIVMAGGPCASNPMPLAEFFDAFFIGEAEEALTEIVNALSAYVDKAERLRELARIEGCYIPALHGIPPRPEFRIKARKFAAFSQNKLTHKPQLLSWQLATHNRYLAEIMRGCSRGCRFCHAGYFYRPVRERGADDILNDILTEVRQSGWDEAGLMSLSSSDYGCIKDLLFNLLTQLDTDKTHISLPSLRVDTLDDETVDLMRKLGREGLTIAPEAGSQRLRDIINKNLSESDILKGVRTAIALGWQKIKLYFMIGLPFEAGDDIDSLIALIQQIDELGRHRLTINLTLSPFVPKPFTPFQWAPVLSPEAILSRCLRVKHAFDRRRNIKINYHNVENSILEAIFARGDHRLGEVIHQAWSQGARFDAWNECFDFSIWESAISEPGLSAEDYLEERTVDAPLPWDFIDLGLSKEFLLDEWKRAARAETTPDCRELCVGCGVCTDRIQTVSAPAVKRLSKTPVPPGRQKTDPQRQYRYRVFYAKTGMLRFISHLDWMRMLFRLIGKLELQTVFTQGFSPHPKVSLSPALPLGMTSSCEYFDISFYRRYSCEQITSAFAGAMSLDFCLQGCEVISGKGVLPFGEVLRMDLADTLACNCKERITWFERQPELIYTKETPKRRKSYDLRRVVASLGLEDQTLYLSKSLSSPSVYDVLAEILAIGKDQLYSHEIQRIDWLWEVDTSRV